MNLKKRGRPCLSRQINFNPKFKYFKPQGIPLNKLETIYLKKEELEALRLKNIEKLDQIQCAENMNTSSSTLQRLLNFAYFKITKALIEGKAIKIITQ